MGGSADASMAAPANGCLWVATLKGEKFFVAPGTPICSSEVKFNG